MLDESVHLYRSNIRLLLSIAALGLLPNLLLIGLREPAIAQPGPSRAILGLQFIIVTLTGIDPGGWRNGLPDELASLVLSALTHGALAIAATQTYAGAASSIGGSFRAATRLLLTLTGMQLVRLGLLLVPALPFLIWEQPLWIICLIPFLPLQLLVIARTAIAAQVVVVERLELVPALRHAWRRSSGEDNEADVFNIVLVTGLIMIIATAIPAAFAAFALDRLVGSGPLVIAISSMLQASATILTTPFIVTTATVFYHHLHLRSESSSLEHQIGVWLAASRTLHESVKRNG